MIKLKDIKDKKVSELTKEQQVRLLLVMNRISMKVICKEAKIDQGFASNIMRESLRYGIKPNPGTKSEKLLKYFDTKLGVKLL